MTISKRVIIAASLISLLGCLMAIAQTPLSIPGSDGVTSMTYVSPGVGYVIVRGRLLRTVNNGVVWTDVTPPGPADQFYWSWFFLGSSNAWIAFVDGSPESWDSNPPVRMVRTIDGGKTWSLLRFDRTSFPDLNLGDSPGGLWFVDAQHGWFEWKYPSALMNSGLVFRTVDGGKTWKELPVAPSSGDFRFHRSKDGWLIGGWSNQELSVTHDGGISWKDVSIPLPPNCSQCGPIYEDLKFQSKNDGTLAVRFSDRSNPDVSREIDNTYVTRNGGNSWQSIDAFEPTGVNTPSGIAALLKGHAIWFIDPSWASWVRIRNGSKTINSLVPAGLNPRGYIVTGSSFVDDLNGWLLYGTDTRSDLLATTDGGKTFKVITPPLPTAPSQSPKE